MHSVEKRGATVEEATALALAELGIDISEADVQVVSPPRRGLFGTAKRAVVRVSRRGTQNTAAAEAEPTTTGEAPADAGSPGPGEQDVAAGAAPHEMDSEEAGDAVAVPATHEENAVTDTTSPPQTDEVVDFDALSTEERMELLDEECDLAADFVEGLLDLLDLPGDIEIEVSEDAAVVNVSDVGSGLLIGRRGATLDALQELVRSSTQRQTERRSHVRVDVEGYRARQLDKLRSKCRDAIAQVRETGEPVRLEPMDAYERKMMHDLIGKTGGVTSSSEGTEPKRRVVIVPE
jgi:spoIIIJ-associated protein